MRILQVWPKEMKWPLGLALSEGVVSLAFTGILKEINLHVQKSRLLYPQQVFDGGLIVVVA